MIWEAIKTNSVMPNNNCYCSVVSISLQFRRIHRYEHARCIEQNPLSIFVPKQTHTQTHTIVLKLQSNPFERALTVEFSVLVPLKYDDYELNSSWITLSLSLFLIVCLWFMVYANCWSNWYSYNMLDISALKDKSIR